MTQGDRKVVKSRMRCVEIQSVMFDYLTRELGSARSEWVAKHLEKCHDCQRAAVDMRATLDLLREASKAPDGYPERLTEERRRRIVRAIMHPVLDWVYAHHVLVSVISVLLILAAVAYGLMKLEIIRSWDDEDMGVPVNLLQPNEWTTPTGRREPPKVEPGRAVEEKPR